MAREREGGVITDVNTQPSLPSRPISKLHSSGGALLIHSSSAVAASPLGEQDIHRDADGRTDGRARGRMIQHWPLPLFLSGTDLVLLIDDSEFVATSYIYL